VHSQVDLVAGRAQPRGEQRAEGVLATRAADARGDGVTEQTQSHARKTASVVAVFLVRL
jgi:hypothetical protein